MGKTKSWSPTDPRHFAFIEMALRNMIDCMKANGELDETFD